MWPQKSFVALAGIRRVKGSSSFFNDCHGKNMFSNSSLLCMYDEFLSMAYIKLQCLFVICTKGFGAGTKKYYYGRYANCELIPNETVLLQFTQFFSLYLLKLPFIFLPKGSSFARGTSIFSLVAAP